MSNLWDSLPDPELELKRLTTLRPREEYHEDYGFVLWFHVPIQEPPEVATYPDDLQNRVGCHEDWHTHWAPLSNEYEVSK